MAGSANRAPSRLVHPGERFILRALEDARSGRHLGQEPRAVVSLGGIVGGDPANGEIYGIAAYEEDRGTLALRNPNSNPRTFKGTLAVLLDLPKAARSRRFKLRWIFGETEAIQGIRQADASVSAQLSPLAIAVVEGESIAPGEESGHNAREEVSV